MASVHSPASLPASPAGGSRGNPAPAKLRDSCHACAASKVKCDKYKPVCGRCTKRGTPCEYVATKRAGRRRESRPSDGVHPTIESPGTRPSLGGGARLWLPPTHLQLSPVEADLISCSTSPINAASASLVSAHTDFDQLFASLVSLPGLDTPTIEPLSPFDANDLHAFHPPDRSVAVGGEAVAKLWSLSPPRTSPTNRDSSTNDAASVLSFADTHPEPTCGCSVHALPLMKAVFPDLASTSDRSQSGLSDATRPFAGLQKLLSENRETIEAIIDILQCTCVQDGYLLSMMSLMVFKLLSWYSAATRKVSAFSCSECWRSPPSDDAKSYFDRVAPQSPARLCSCHKGQDQRRMTLQRVLGELHRVQRLINLLSQRWKAHRAPERPLPTPDNCSSRQDFGFEDEHESPFSAAMSDQLEADLRQRLRTLSQDIIDNLRKE